MNEWLEGDPSGPPPPERRKLGRNHEWNHLYNAADVLSMPDKWEFPWYASWDLAFQCVALALVDSEFAKEQLMLLVREWYMHPNGQLPAYEWGLDDVNPPVHAWAAWRVYKIDEKRRGSGDRTFLQRIFHKLLLNFTWWVNRKDGEGHNVFQGGFLGLDRGTDMWSEEDGFFYDVLHTPDDRYVPLGVRSMVGLVPLFAVETLEPRTFNRLTGFKRRLDWFIQNRPDLTKNVACMETKGQGERLLLSIVDGGQLRRVLRVMLDEAEFLSPYGIRSLSRHHKDHPYVLSVDDTGHRVGYDPGRVLVGRVQRKLELARPGLVPGKLPPDRIFAEVSPLLWARIHRTVSGGIGRFYDPVGSRGRVIATPCPYLLEDARGQAPGERAECDLRKRPALARLDSVPRILPWRRRRGPGREPSNRLDGAGRQAAPAEWRKTVPAAIQFGADVLGDPEAALKREWLETNGIGGFASSTIWGMNTRRNHGLLTAATKPPLGRMVLLSKLEETILLDGVLFELSTNRYPGVLHPRGFERLVHFRLDPFPVSRYSAGGIEIEKTVLHGAWREHDRCAVRHTEQSRLHDGNPAIDGVS